MSEIMLRCENVSKQYRLGAIGGTTLKEDLQRLSARLRKKEDPTVKIGQKSRPISNDKFLALDGVSFEVKKGEAIGIIGKNGAGKSTLLKLITRITGPTKGTISLNGRVASMLEVGTGFHPELTGRENIYMNGAILGMSKSEIDKKIEQIIDFSEVRQFIDTPVKRYSSGMYVKLAFSVAAHLDSEIVIMDEVLAVGDMAFQTKCLTKMRQSAQEEGRTVLYVSHNMNTIRQLCDRVIVLDKGKLIFDGDVEEGIKIYINNGNETGSKNPCAEPRNPGYMLDDAIRLEKVYPADRENFVYGIEEKACIGVDYKTTQSFEKLAFRMTVCSVDGNAVGLATTAPGVKTSVGEGSMKLNLNLEWLAPGKYTVNFIVYSVNEFGGNTLHDVVENAFAFEKTQGDANNRMNWNSRYWGHIMFPRIETEN